MIFRSKNTYSPNARNSFNTYKHITKLRTIKSKTIYNMTHILKTDLVFFFFSLINLLSSKTFLFNK